MNSSGRGTGIVGYNLQAAVDAEHHLIVAHEVVNEGNDRAQLAPMGRQAQAAIAAPEITVLADRGYMNGEQVLECEGTGILPCVPRTDTSGKPSAVYSPRPTSCTTPTMTTIPARQGNI